MKKIFYEKVGRRYVPVSEYNSELIDAMPKGCHIIMSYPGGQSTRYKIDPAYAPMIAAGRVAEDAISSAISRTSEVRRRERSQRALTNEQYKAWNKFIDVMGEDARMLEYASVREIAEAGVQAMQEEANKLLENPAVKLAYDHFLLVCELTKEHNDKK